MNIWDFVIGTLILWGLTYGVVVPLAKVFTRIGGADSSMAPSSTVNADAGKKADAIDNVPTGAFILIHVLVLGVAGLLLGAIAGLYFIGIAYKAKMWPGMITLIVTSLLGAFLISPVVSSILPLKLQPVFSSSAASTPMSSESIPASNSQQNQVGGICWTYELKNFDGNRSQVWDLILDDKTKKLLEYKQFKDDVVIHNPQLKDDGYVFYGQKTYVLPELCH
jgi:hypothetical protein